MAEMTEAVAQLRDVLGDRFSVERALGRGGMGAVYLARDRRLDRLVALKVLPAEFAAQHELRERFLRETRTAASFSHPNIVPVFSIEEHGPLLAYAMGYVEGETLAELVARAGPLGVRDAVRLLQDIGYALAYAHQRGVVHRDLKPDNIMIERATGRALLMDFGISRSVHTPLPGELPAGATRAGLTRVGEVVGTPEFMSPEQAAGDAVDGRSDLYALGLVGWYALTGSSAMQGDSTHKVLVKQLTEAVPPVRSVRSDAPPALEEVIARCVAKSPDERFASAEALVDALDVSALRGVDIPLPVRLVAQDISQAGLVLGFGVIMLPLMLAVLNDIYGDANLDIILPLVGFASILWGRAAQTVRYVRTVITRGFGVDALQAGFTALLGEREMERAQLRADPQVVQRRRRQVILFVALFAMSYVLQTWVRATMRVETSPGWFSVKPAGAVILYAAAVMRGISIVGILRSPLRANFGEKLFALWTRAPGRWALSLMATGLERAGGSTTIPPTGPATGSAQAAASAPAAAVTSPGPSLEARVAELEAWRRRVER
jgi:eukaryotic-like serine/threonine-protein kinase